MPSPVSTDPGTDLLCGPDIDLELQILLAGCVRTLYAAIGARNAATACAFTSIVLADALTRIGVTARAVAVAVECRLPHGRFGIGHPGYPLERPDAWKGHACCMIGDVLIDPTISQIRWSGVAAPLMAAVRTRRPWVPDATLEIAAGARVTWQAEGAAGDLQAHPDLLLPVRAPATARAATALAQHLARHAIARVARQA